MQDTLWPRSSSEDRELLAVRNWLLGQSDFRARFARAVRRAFDDAINPFGTGRVSVEDLTKPEKTIVGMMVERSIREEFDLQRGKTLDFRIAKSEVDCKFSLYQKGWMIPTEAVGRLCLIVWANDGTRQLAAGLVRASQDVLTAGANQDKKRSISRAGMESVSWLIDGRFLPPNRLLALSKDERIRVLGGTEGERRARELFMRCEGMAIRFTDVAAALSEIGYALLDGNSPGDRKLAQQLGGPVPGPGEWLCLEMPDDQREAL